MVGRRGNKYRAKRVVTADGQAFDSKAEYRRSLQLALLERAGSIKDIERQPEFQLVVNGCNCGSYRADFAFVDCATGARVIEDVKGVRTPIFILKKKLVKALHGVDVIEVAA